MDFDPIIFGKRLKKLRAQEGITQKALGKKIHISSKLVSDIERGRRKLTAYELVALSEYFGVSADYLLLGCTSSPEDGAYLQDMVNKVAKDLLFLQNYLETHI